jgi:homoserine acetyltransferase
LENARELPPVDPKAYMSQVMAVNTHKVAKDRLKKLCNYPIEILVITASDDQLVAPKHSYALNKVSRKRNRNRKPDSKK